MIIKKTPTNPKIIATPLLRPKLSLRKILAAIVIVRGNDCKMALTLANGILINAVRKKIVANNSKNDLIEIKGRILKHSFKFLFFEKEKNTRINKVQKIPLIKIDCSKFNSEAIIFIIASLATKPAIETLIKKAPTIFLEYDFM